MRDDDCRDIRPSVSPYRQSWWLEEHEFDQVAERAFESLPQQFKDGLDNVQIQPLDEPEEEHLSELHPGVELLGLYVGFSLDRRDRGYVFKLPDMIYLFSNPIQRVSHSREQAKEEIRKTLWHEIGHYYGLSDAQLRKLGY